MAAAALGVAADSSLAQVDSTSTGADVVVPRVVSWTSSSSSWTLGPTSRIVVDNTTATLSTAGPSGPTVVSRTLRQTADTIASDLLTVTGQTVSVVVGEVPATGDISVRLSADAELGDEGYAITIGPQLTISAPTATGVHRGSRTVLQMLRVAGADLELSRGTIRDYPSLSHRVISVDVGRRYWEIDSLKNLIRSMSWLKLNFLQLHLNESEAFRLYSPDYAGLAPTDPDKRYSQQQMSELERFAADHHVVIVPEIDLPSHATAIALGGGLDRSLRAECGSRFVDVLDYTDADTREWALDLIREFLPWFSGPYFHIGNDEVPPSLANCQYIQTAIANDADIENFEDLQERFANEEAELVEKENKRALMWANAANVLPSTDIILVNFGGTGNARTLRQRGYDVIDTAYKTGNDTLFFLIPSLLGDGRHVPRGDIYDYTPPDLDSSHNLGRQMAVWADIFHFGSDQYLLQEIEGRDAELAERTWNASPTTASYSEFSDRVAAIGSAPGTTSQLPPRSNDNEPEHHYTFDAGYTYSDSSHFVAATDDFKIVQDMVDNLHGTGSRGTYFMTPTLGVSGPVGSAAMMQWHSDPSRSTRFVIGGPDLEPPWTMTAWVYRSAGGSDTAILGSWKGAIKLEQHRSTNLIGISEHGTADWTFNHSVPLREWTHVALVATADNTTLYLDGELQQSISHTIDLPQGLIGGTRPYTGRIDELRLYDSAISADEIAALAAEGTVAAQPTAPAVFQAHGYSGSSGTVASNALAPDYTSVGGIGAGDWIRFDEVDFSGSPDILMVFLAAGAGDVGDRIEVRLDAVSGAKIADLAIADTGGNRVFSEQYASVSGASGVHDIYLVFPSATQANIDWFVFSKNPDGETDGERVQRIQWWRDARFGQFIHWGAYSHLAGSYGGDTLQVNDRRVSGYGEWIMKGLGIPINDYETSAAVAFNPTSFNASEWARVAKEAGQKYVVITSKHHDGFNMFDTNVRGFQTKSPSISPARDYDISDVGSYGSDPIAEFASATRAQGLRFGLYYSILDWHFIYERGNSGDAGYLPAMKEQLRELVEKYDPALLWFDGEWYPHPYWPRATGEALYKYLRVLKPDLVINDRVVKREFFAHGDGDYDTTAERTGPEYPSVVDWENSQTMNSTWGYKAIDTNWKPASQFIEELVSVTSRNGNYLLNIGPDGTGTIPSASVTRLKTVGDWLATYGPAIYGTDKPNPLKDRKPSWGWYTTKGNTVYAIVKDWPADGRLELEDLNSVVSRVSSLSSPGTTYGTGTSGGRVAVTGLPPTAPSSHLSVLELSIEGEIGGTSHNLAHNRPTEVSDFYNSDPTYNGAEGC